jgi:hypothetical protein
MTDDLTEKLEATRKENAERIQRLAIDGVGIDPMGLLKQRVDLITDILVGSGLISETLLEDMWEETMAEILDGAEKQVTAAKLGIAN